MAKKRANGTGYIHKLKDGRGKPWVVYEPRIAVTITDRKGNIVCDSAGNPKTVRKSKRIGSFATRTEAQKALDEYNTRIKNQEEEEIKIEFGKVIDEVIEWKRNIDTPVATIRCYQSAKNKLAHLSHIPISEIKYKDLQQVADRLSIGSPSSISMPLQATYKYAIRNNYVKTNLADLILYKKKRTKPNSGSIFENEEIRKIWNLEKTGDDKQKKMARLVLVLLYTGARISEIVNLKSSDIDLDNDCIKITRSKTLTGIRDIPIHPKIKHILKYYKSAGTNEFAKKPKTEETDTKKADRNINTLLRRNGFNHTSHDCRRTFLTQAYHQKLDWLIIEKSVGHYIQDVGRGIYVKNSFEEMKKEVFKLNYPITTGINMQILKNKLLNPLNRRKLS